jgi:LacI family transcriptional regulator
MKVNIYDVAKKSGLSIATVSRVINHSEQVKEETRSRVLKIIEELNYFPNTNATGLAKEISYTIGALLPSFDDFSFPDSFSMDFLNGVQCALSRKGYNLLIINNRDTNEADTRAEFNRLIQSKKIDGLIVLSSGKSSAIFKQNLDPAFPMTFVGHEEAPENAGHVHLDFKDYYREAIEYLVQKGHTKIIVLFYANKEIELERMHLIEKIFKDIDTSDTIQYRLVNGIGYKRRIFSKLKEVLSKEDYSAIITDSPTYAQKAIDIANHLNKHIPKDLSIITFEYSEDIAKDIYPSMDSLYLSSFDIGFKGTNLLLERIESGTPGVEVWPETRMIVRGSVSNRT